MERGKSGAHESSVYLTWVNTLLLICIAPLAAVNSCSRPEAIIIGESSSSVSVGEDAKESLQLAEDSLVSGDFEGAFDMLLVGSRLAPTDPRLFDLMEGFVEKAVASKSDDSITMAEDLLDRFDSLVYFQRTNRVMATRKRFDGIRATLRRSETTFEQPSPLIGVRQLLDVARNTNQVKQVRTRATEQARSLLDDIQFQIALGDGTQTAQVTPKAIDELYVEIDKIEQQYIESLFNELKPRIDAWQVNSASLVARSENAPNEEAPEIGRSLGKAADLGYNLLQELSPYSKSEVTSAADLSRKTEALVTELQRQKNWLYNKQALALIREVEAEKSQTPKQKIGYLAEIHEEQLSTYVLRRHNDVWEKVFEELPNDEEKVSAVRLRILRKSK